MKLVIIGPRSVGKTTIATLLAKKLKYKHIESDKVMNSVLKKYGGLSHVINEGRKDLIAVLGFSAVTKILKRENIIFDMPGGRIISTIGKKLGYVEKTLNRFAQKDVVVVVLQPCWNIQKSIDFLFEREKKRTHFQGKSHRELYQKVARNYKDLRRVLKSIADIHVWVKGKTPEQIIEEVFKQL